MGKPCGCGGAGITVRCRNGIKCSGVGSAVSPLIIEWEIPLGGAACAAVMDCVGANIGMGLVYNTTSRQLSVRISSDAGNTLVPGTDNGLFAPGGGGGGEVGYATVDGLAARTTPFVGGSYGGGYANHPEPSIDAYRAGLDMELPLMHVPVRRTYERFLLAQHYRAMGVYNWRYTADTTVGMDLMMARHMWYLPGGDPTATAGNWRWPGYANQAGYFGFGVHDYWGATLLSDVLSLVQRRSVLYLECKDVGQSAGDTLNPIETLRRIRFTIGQFGLAKSVIVGSEYPLTANSIALAQIIEGLQEINSDGVAVALHLTSEAMVDAVPPQTMWDLGFRWVFIQYGVADASPAKVKAYKDRGFNVVLFTGHRQWHWALTNDATRFGTGGLKGILCSDPVYCSGEVNGYRYRSDTASWGWGTPDYGRHAYVGDIPWMRDRFRGYVRLGQAGHLTLDGDVLGPAETDPNLRASGYMILQGEQCPTPNFDPVTRVSNNYEIHVGFVWEGIPSDRGRWQCVFLGAPEDRSLTEWELATEYTRGYMIQLNASGNFVATRYDGAYPPVDPPGGPVWASGWGNLSANIEYRITIQVRPNSITVSRADGGGAREFTGDWATRWRGGYFYYGRHFFNIADSAPTRWVWGVCRAIPA